MLNTLISKIPSGKILHPYFEEMKKSSLVPLKSLDFMKASLTTRSSFLSKITVHPKLNRLELIISCIFKKFEISKHIIQFSEQELREAHLFKTKTECVTILTGKTVIDAQASWAQTFRKISEVDGILLSQQTILDLPRTAIKLFCKNGLKLELGFLVKEVIPIEQHVRSFKSHLLKELSSLDDPLPLITSCINSVNQYHIRHLESLCLAYFSEDYLLSLSGRLHEMNFRIKANNTINVSVGMEFQPINHIHPQLLPYSILTRTEFVIDNNGRIQDVIYQFTINDFK
jgi:hypothetical protein